MVDVGFLDKEQAALLFCNIVPDTFIKDKSGNETFFEFNGGDYHLDGHGDEGVDGFYDRYCIYEYCLRLIEEKDH